MHSHIHSFLRYLFFVISIAWHEMAYFQFQCRFCLKTIRGDHRHGRLCNQCHHWLRHSHFGRDPTSWRVWSIDPGAERSDTRFILCRRTPPTPRTPVGLEEHHSIPPPRGDPDVPVIADAATAPMEESEEDPEVESIVRRLRASTRRRVHPYASLQATQRRVRLRAASIFLTRIDVPVQALRQDSIPASSLVHLAQSVRNHVRTIPLVRTASERTIRLYRTSLESSHGTGTSVFNG